jgi:hypothetical protein
MAKDGKPPTANSWPAEGHPIDVACQRVLAPLWDAYTQARSGVSDFAVLRRAWRNASRGRGKLILKPDKERPLDAWIELNTALRRRLEEGNFELRGRRGSPVAQEERIPASALKWLDIDYEEQTAAGQGEQFYDLRMHAPKAARKLTPKAWIADEVNAMRQAGQLPAGITDCSRVLYQRMQDAHKQTPSLRVLQPRTIENYLRKLKLRSTK